MRLLPVAILTGLIHYNGLSPTDYKRIKISKDNELIQLSETAYKHISIADLPDSGRFPSNGLNFINRNKAFLFDTPLSLLSRATIPISMPACCANGDFRRRNINAQSCNASGNYDFVRAGKTGRAIFEGKCCGETK